MTRPSATALTLRYAARTHPSRRRRNNQDAVLVRDRVYQKPWRGSGALDDGAPLLVAVADGVSASPAPAAASRAVLSALRDSFKCDPARSVRRHVDVTNSAFCAVASSRQKGMASTLVATIVHEGRAVVFNSGDSRAYLLSPGRARQLTKDHTVLQSMLDQGDITPEQAVRAANFYSALDSCFIADPLAGTPELAVSEVQLTPGVALLLCSDGLTHYATDAEIAAAWDAPGPMVEKLFNTAMAHGGDDDISMVLLACEE